MHFRIFNLSITAMILLILNSCATGPQKPGSGISVDVASREIGKMHTVAWAAFSAEVRCESNCVLSPAEQQAKAAEILDQSFSAIDRELRVALNGKVELVELGKTLENPNFSQEIRTESYRSSVGRWIGKLGLSQAPSNRLAARGLKVLDPDELGWSGEESLARLGQGLGVDGVVVANLVVVFNGRDAAIEGPRLSVFSSHANKRVIAARRASSLNVVELDLVAQSFSDRIRAEF